MEHELSKCRVDVERDGAILSAGNEQELNMGVGTCEQPRVALGWQGVALETVLTSALVKGHYGLGLPGQSESLSVDFGLKKGSRKVSALRITRKVKQGPLGETWTRALHDLRQWLPHSCHCHTCAPATA